MKIFSNKIIEKTRSLLSIKSYYIGVSIKRDWKHVLVIFFLGIAILSAVGMYIYTEIDQGEALFTTNAVTAPGTVVFDKKKLDDVVVYYTKKEAEYRMHVENRGRYVDPSF
ncbi:MAG: hypothetical protein WC757_02970 [Candidatus Paceibacterota bacterium]|jgi:hypothetical protein